MSFNSCPATAETSAPPIARVAILIVGFRNADDIKGCLRAIAQTDKAPTFDIFICENGGARAYDDLLVSLLDPGGPCAAAAGAELFSATQTDHFRHVRKLRLRGRSSTVWIGCAYDNLGYAGGINSWLRQFMPVPGWKGLWILNPDTEPTPLALAALIQRAEVGDMGMVGSTIVEASSSRQVRLRGGISWQRLLGRGIAIGLGDLVDAPHDLSAIEMAMDSPSGCSMYVTRACADTIGLMDERFFLFFEDLDWGMRAKICGIGYASDSIIVHKRGTTTGSANSLQTIPRLSVYLEHRNSIHFVRKHFAWALPFRIAASVLYAARFLIHGAPKNCAATLQGLAAGLRGEFGRPRWHRDLTAD